MKPRIIRCERGYLHDPNDWICPWHKAPPKPQKTVRRPSGPCTSELVARAIAGGATDCESVRAWVLKNCGRHFTVENFRNGLKYLREKGVVEMGAKSSVLRFTEAGAAFFGGEKSEAAE